MTRRDLTDEQRERLAKALREEVAPRVQGPGGAKLDQSAIGKALHAQPSTISRLLGEPPVGGSLHLVEEVARYLNVPVPQSDAGTWPSTFGQQWGGTYAGDAQPAYWRGFQRRWATGLELHHKRGGE